MRIHTVAAARAWASENKGAARNLMPKRLPGYMKAMQNIVRDRLERHQRLRLRHRLRDCVVVE